MNYQPIIGLEVHVELKTKSKMFCGCPTDYFGQKPNTHTCPVCLGLPGALPVPNKKAIDWCIMIGLALNCKIANFSKFDRKNYFYADLPKGYQISQYDQPFCQNGFIELSNDKKIGITRVHMEEDTGKLIHQENASLIDFNRSGVPLVEIVTEPDFESAKEVVEYLKKLQQIVRYLGVSDADMEKGEMRLEPNISLRINDKGLSNKLPRYKVEVKNINSFKFVDKAIEFEIKRQTEILESGKTPVQETRGWDEDKQKTVSQRLKEEANDYRYFPEPDIPPLRFTDSQISNRKSQMPELPDEKRKRFQKDFGLSVYDTEILTRDKETSDYFEEAVIVAKNQVKNLNIRPSPKIIANWIINKKVDIHKVLPAELIKKIILAGELTHVDDLELEKVVKNILFENKKAVEDYNSGKIQVIGFLIGKTKQHLPKADTNQIKTAIQKLIALYT